MTTKANRIERYYDTHELEGAELTQSRIHHAIIMHLMLIIQWIFNGNGKNVGVTGYINFYQTDSPGETAKSPDIAVVEGLETDPNKLEDTPSYYVGEDGPPPMVVFEIASKETWRQDLEDKPAKYQAMGVPEYFVFDPNKRSFWTGQWRKYNRLIGWRKDPVSGQYKLIEKDPDGRLWSEELASWLVVEGNDLQLYSSDGQLRLTKEEAEARRAEVEARRAEIAQRQAEIARQDAEAERQEKIRLKELLRKLGHNPDDLL
jgi:Uma2 family endonuclease